MTMEQSEQQGTQCRTQRFASANSGETDFEEPGTQTRPSQGSGTASDDAGHHAGHHHIQHQRPLEVVFQNISAFIPLKKKSTASPSLAALCEPIKFKLLSGRRRSSVLPTTATRTSSCSEAVADSKAILSDVSGFARPGQMLGIMGPSGSGKTTLLSALSGRLKADRGSITLNGETLNKQLRRKICYVLQQDIFFPDLTLRQTLVYTALLRLPDSMSHEHKMRHVDHIIDVLDLRHCQHTIIGDMLKRGLSGGEKKRASVACELLTNPTVMLIDEPTSGLDSSTAHTLMQTLKDYAVKERKTMIASVHQPSSQIFYQFDKLLLLSGGRVAFFGDVQDVVPFFSRIGLQIAPHYNPADFVMEKVKGSLADQEKIITAAMALVKSPKRRSSSSSSSSRPTPIMACDVGITTVEDDHETATHNHQIEISSSYKSSATHESPATTRTGEDSLDHRNDDVPKSHPDESPEASECNPLWSGYHHHRDVSDHQHDGCCDPSRERGNEKEMRVVIDPREKVQKVYNKIVNDDDSGRSSWTDRSSTATFSSTSASSSVASSDEMYFDFSFNKKKKSSSSSDRNQKWQTCFLTQVSVLTQRNFYEARGRMLSKLNWIQTVGLALVSGLIWMQVARREESLKDIQGWMFWSMTYWMLHALFSAMVSFPPEREVISKERSSGAYRLSAYYVAKMIGELPLTVALPTVFHCISYPLMGYNNLTTFLLLWAFLILSIVVAQSVGIFIGAACVNLEVSVTIAAIYSLSTMLFGGYYATTIPDWLSWMRYLSMVFYSFQNMQMIEFEYGPPIICSENNSKYASCLEANWTLGDGEPPPTVPYEELREQLDVMSTNSVPLPVWFNTLVLIAFLVFFRLAGYLVLRYLRKPK